MSEEFRFNPPRGFISISTIAPDGFDFVEGVVSTLQEDSFRFLPQEDTRHSLRYADVSTLQEDSFRFLRILAAL